MKSTITEAEFMEQVVQLAALKRWRIVHFAPARTNKGYRTPCRYDAKGWPDLVLVKDRVIYAELKVKKPLTFEQCGWIEALQDADAEVYVWTPSDWKTIELVLQ